MPLVFGGAPIVNVLVSMVIHPPKAGHQSAAVRRVRARVGRRGDGAVLPACRVTSTATTQSDCVVVGASFAGLACATALARAGMRVIVLERKADVGEKLHTTGIIVKDAIDQIALLDGLPSSIVRRIEGVRLYAPSLRHVDLAAPGYYFLATDTPQLMRWLAERAVEAGAIIAHQTSFVTAQRTQSGFDLGDAGTTRFIVGADGPELARRAGPRTWPKQQVPVRRRARVRRRGASPNPTGCTASSIGVSRRATSAGSWPASASCRLASPGACSRIG